MSHVVDHRAGASPGLRRGRLQMVGRKRKISDLVWKLKKIDSQSKSQNKKSPVSETPREEIEAEWYWYLKAKERFFDEWQDETWTYGQAFIQDSHSVIFNAKIHASAKKDRKAKKLVLPT